MLLAAKSGNATIKPKTILDIVEMTNMGASYLHHKERTIRPMTINERIDKSKTNGGQVNAKAFFLLFLHNVLTSLLTKIDQIHMNSKG